MTEIAKEESFKVMTNLKKGVSGSVVVSLALVVMSCIHGLTPEQQQAGLVLVTGILESARNILKKKLPRLFSWF
jgi:hypothetical protein